MIAEIPREVSELVERSTVVKTPASDAQEQADPEDDQAAGTFHQGQDQSRDEDATAMSTLESLRARLAELRARRDDAHMRQNLQLLEQDVLARDEKLEKVDED